MNPKRLRSAFDWVGPARPAEIHHGAQHICCRQTPNTWPQPTSRRKLTKPLPSRSHPYTGSSRGC